MEKKSEFQDRMKCLIKNGAKLKDSEIQGQIEKLTNAFDETQYQSEMISRLMDSGIMGVY